MWNTLQKTARPFPSHYAFTKGNISVVGIVRTASISSSNILIKSSSHIKMFNMTATQLIMYLQYVVELPLGYYWFCLFDFNAYSLSQILLTSKKDSSFKIFSRCRWVILSSSIQYSKVSVLLLTSQNLYDVSLILFCP